MVEYTELTEELLETLREAGVKKLSVLYVNDLDQGPYISSTLNIDPRTVFERGLQIIERAQFWPVTTD